MRSQLETRSVWLNLELTATSIPCHPHTAVTKACNINCGWGFGLGGGTVNHSTSPSVSLFFFICLSRSQRHSHMSHKLAGRHGLKFLWKPQQSPFTHSTLITPYRLTACAHSHADSACIHIFTHTHTHKKGRFVFLFVFFSGRNWKQAFLMYSSLVFCCSVRNLHACVCEYNKRLNVMIFC